MNKINSALDSLYRVCGQKAYLADGERADGRTYFSVQSCGCTHEFYIDGDGERDAVVAALAREYLTTALSKSAAVDNPVREFLLGGALPPGVRIGKADFYVFAVFCAPNEKSVYEYLSAMSARDDLVGNMGDGTIAFCKKAGDDSDYRSAGEFALVLRENLLEEIKSGIKIGVGGVSHGTGELASCYACAKSALVSGAEFDPGSDIYSYNEYALIRILSELPASTKEKYIKTALDKSYREVLGDGELMAAADAFIRHSLNVSEASRHMYVHRNTLIYRLDKIEKITGLDIRNFNDAMTFRVAYLISKSL